MAGVLIVAGLTDSILAFDGEINGWLNPPQRVEAQVQPILDLFELCALALLLRPLRPPRRSPTCAAPRSIAAICAAC